MSYHTHLEGMKQIGALPCHTRGQIGGWFAEWRVTGGVICISQRLGAWPGNIMPTQTIGAEAHFNCLSSSVIRHFLTSRLGTDNEKLFLSAKMLKNEFYKNVFSDEILNSCSFCFPLAVFKVSDVSRKPFCFRFVFSY